MAPTTGIADRRPLPARTTHRRRRHGRGVGGRGLPAGPHGRRQDPQGRAHRRPRVPAPLPHRGAHGRLAEQLRHHRGARLRRDHHRVVDGQRHRAGADGLPGHGAGPRRAAGPDPRRPRAPRRRLHARHPRAERVGARGGARARARPPRRQAGQHPRDARGPGEDHRLRHRQGRRRGPGDPLGHGHGHRALHRPRAGRRRRRGPGLGRLLPRRGRLRVPRGAPSVPVGERGDGRDDAHPRPAAAAAERRPARGPPADRGDPGQGPAPALRHGRRVRPGRRRRPARRAAPPARCRLRADRAGQPADPGGARDVARAVAARAARTVPTGGRPGPRSPVAADRGVRWPRSRSSPCCWSPGCSG